MEETAFPAAKLAEERRPYEAGPDLGAFADGERCVGLGIFPDGQGLTRNPNVETIPPPADAVVDRSDGSLS